MAKLKATARQCSVCGGPIQDRNTFGICHRTPACDVARAEAIRRAKGRKPRRNPGCHSATCPEPHYAHGWCQMHWLRIKKTGDSGPDGRMHRRYSAAAGDVLGCWTLLDDYKAGLVPCRCTCGNERLMEIRYLLKHVDQQECLCRVRAGRPPGRAMNAHLERLYLPAGFVSGRLTVLEDVGNAFDHVHCICECGNETRSPIARSLIRGLTKSCGCLAQESRTKHGMCKHPLYPIWHLMVRRCTVPHDKSYADYGGRGIAVHENWLGLPDGLLAFAEHIGPRPSMHHTVDRRDVDGDYAPGNVRWATYSEQSRNKRTVGALTSERDALQAQVDELTAALAVAQVPRRRRLASTASQDALF